MAICADDVAERQVPQLSSVTIPAERIGAQAVESLITKLEGGEVPGLTLLPPALTARGSTAPLHNRPAAPAADR
jgi:DNA-binding LacI/PurR family transcriptional regulator